MNRVNRSISPISVLLALFYLVSGFIILYYLYTGLDYYLTSFSLRVRHADYKILKPGGFRSHGFGIIGSLFLVSLLFYSLRKRIRLFQNWGNFSSWLRIHIFFGLMGPLFIILHSTFKLNGLVSVSFWSMITVSLSGILGRYLYTQIPRNIQGKELSLSEVEKYKESLNQKMTKKYGLEPAQISTIENLLSRKTNSLSASILSDMIRPFSQRKLTQKLKTFANLSKPQIKEMIRTAQEKYVLERRIRMWNRVHNLFHYWHVFHKPFAIVMYIIMLVHISISVWLGYTWIF